MLADIEADTRASALDGLRARGLPEYRPGLKERPERFGQGYAAVLPVN